MKFKKVNENKIVIILSEAELESRNMDLTSIRDNSIAYQKLFWDMMEKAESELGFDVSGSQLVVETAPDKNGNILITITKSGGISTKPAINFIERMMSEILKTMPEDMLIPGNIIEEQGYDHEVIRFDNIDNIIEFCKSVNNVSGITSMLYHYDNTYYLVMKRTRRNNKAVSNLLEAALEFNGSAAESYLLYSMLEERGSKIIKTKAIKLLAESF